MQAMEYDTGIGRGTGVVSLLYSLHMTSSRSTCILHDSYCLEAYSTSDIYDCSSMILAWRHYTLESS